MSLVDFPSRSFFNHFFRVCTQSYFLFCVELRFSYVYIFYIIHTVFLIYLYASRFPGTTQRTQHWSMSETRDQMNKFKIVKLNLFVTLLFFFFFGTPATALFGLSSLFIGWTRRKSRRRRHLVSSEGLMSDGAELLHLPAIMFQPV